MVMNQLRPELEIISDHVLNPGSPEYDRGQRLRNRVISATPHVCIERARLVTQAYQEFESDSILIRRAKAFDKILRGMSVYIIDDELVVGHQASKQRSAPLFPELAVEWVEEELDTFYTRPQDRFKVTDEVRKELKEEIIPYWKGKTLSDRMYSHITKEVKMHRFVANTFSVGLHEDGGLGHVLLDYEKVLQQGLRGIKQEIHKQMKNLKLWQPSEYKKKHFYESALIICDAVIAFAHRYAVIAREMALVETNSTRKAELLQIAENCEHVPENPARTFWEALQSFWFVQLIPQIYDNGVSITPGRFDQYMYPFYAADLENKRLDREHAQELLEAVWVKFTEPIKIYRAIDAAFHAGYPMGQNLVVGGLGPDGTDATNDLSYRCLEAHSHMLLMQPNFSVRLHHKSPSEFLFKASEAIKLGNGMPQIVNDEVFVPSLLNIGVPLKEARDYAPVGCVEVTPKNTWGRCNGGYFNLAKVVELALNNGKCRITNKQIGPKTGNPGKFQNFDEVVEAYKRQMEHAVQQLVTWDNVVDMVHEELLPTPFTSLLVADCIENGKDVTAGGARYNWTGPLGVGIANAGDTLMAVKKLVFDDKFMSMSEMVELLDTDYEGKEDIRQYFINKVPKFGNDLAEADSMVKLATDIYLDELEGYETYRGGPFVAALLPVASYVAFGMTTGATPDGRKAKDPLADGISPSAGADRHGPTAVFKSVCTIDHSRCPNGVIFNQKFNPESLSTPEGLKKFADLIRTYISLGGAHIQFNIISSDILRDAQVNPEKHRGLVVRVAGYSAFFHELCKEIQDSIIARTEQNLE